MSVLFSLATDWLAEAPHNGLAAGLSTTLVENLFLEIQQRRLPAEVQSVYVTAFQIMNETIQDLLQMHEAEADAKQSHRRGQEYTMLVRMHVGNGPCICYLLF